MRYLPLAATVLFCTILNGCSTPQGIYNGRDDIMGIYAVGSDGKVFDRSDRNARIALASANRTILETKYGTEQQFLRRKGVPQLGLSLSGGGTRSASFSIGVLKGLTELGVMSGVDMVSAVSGGAYATYWYFTQNCYLNLPAGGAGAFCDPADRNDEDLRLLEKARNSFTPDIIFAAWNDPSNGTSQQERSNIRDPNDYRFQLALEGSSDILTYQKREGIVGSLQNASQQAGNIFTHSLITPFHWLFNGLFDWDVNLNPYRRYYQNGLERTYGLVPLTYDYNHYANDTSLVFAVNQQYSLSNPNEPFQNRYDSHAIRFPRINAQQVPLSRMAGYLRAKKEEGKPLPFFIINTTGGFSRAFKKFSSEKNREVCAAKREVCNAEPPPKAGRCSNYCAESEEVCLQRRMSNALFEFTPLWYGSNLVGYYPVDSAPEPVSFSQAVAISGAAVDRQQEAVDIAGNSQGSSATVEAAMDLLNADIGYRISNPRTNGFVQVLHKVMPFPLYYLLDAVEGDSGAALHLSDGGHTENLGAFSLVRRGVKKIIIVDAEQDNRSTFSSAQRLKVQLKKELGLEMSFDQVKTVDVFHTPLEQAVFLGKIKGLVGENGAEEDLELLYIKLSMDRNRLQPPGHNDSIHYPFSVTGYQVRDEDFPHNSTVDVFFSPEQYRAYRDLGYSMVMGNREKIRAFATGGKAP